MSEAPGGATGKGRPTPTRKQAEAARKHTLRVPSDPKEAKKAVRERAAAERAEARAGLASGDDRYLPARDAGPTRKFVRDYVDSRWTPAEFFLPIALVVLIVGFLPLEQIQGTVSMFWMLLTLFILVDTSLLLRRMRREMAVQWPDAADRKGTTMYAVMRLLQLRRLRLPKPTVSPSNRLAARRARQKAEREAAEQDAAAGNATSQQPATQHPGAQHPTEG